MGVLHICSVYLSEVASVHVFFICGLNYLGNDYLDRKCGIEVFVVESLSFFDFLGNFLLCHGCWNADVLSA